MFDAGISSVRAWRLESVSSSSVLASDLTSTPQTRCSSAGAARIASMSCWSCWTAERRSVATGRGEGWQAERKRATTGTEHAARADRARPLLRNLIQRLDDVVEIGRVDLRGAGFARARGERVGAGLAEAD